MFSEKFIPKYLVYPPNPKHKRYITGNKIIILGPKYTTISKIFNINKTLALSSANSKIIPVTPTRYVSEKITAFSMDLPTFPVIKWDK